MAEIGGGMGIERVVRRWSEGARERGSEEARGDKALVRVATKRKDYRLFSPKLKKLIMDIKKGS